MGTGEGAQTLIRIMKMKVGEGDFCALVSLVMDAAGSRALLVVRSLPARRSSEKLGCCHDLLQ